ncbi:MAG TPA: hypothetical protein VF384_00595 [Planctomycetota bacterium]
MRALIALLVFAAIVACFALWGAGPRAPSPAVPAGPASAGAPQTAVAPLANAAGAASPTIDNTSTQRQAAEPAITGPEANVRVVLASNGEPVAGATVRFRQPRFGLTDVDVAQQLREEFEGGEFGDREALLQRIGLQVVTDAEGRCRVAVGESGTEVVARSGELFAQGRADAYSTDEVVLRLRPDCTLRVLVLDAAGRPAPGVLLWMTRTREHGPEGWELGPTDAEGRFEHRHTQRYLGDANTGTAQIAASPPAGQSEAVTFDLAAPPPEIVLRLPAAGSVTVRLRDARGQPLDISLLADPLVTLTAYDREPETRDERMGWSARIDANAEAAFSPVVFGRYLVVGNGPSLEQVDASAEAEQSSLGLRRHPPQRRSTLEHGFTGPTAANPHVDVTLQESPKDVILLATLRLADGKPVAARTFTVSCRSGNDVSSNDVRSGTTGRMRCNLGNCATSEDCVVCISSDAEGHLAALALELPPRGLTAGINDLGELRIEPQGVLVAGRFVPDAGIRGSWAQLGFERRLGNDWVQQEHWRMQLEQLPDGTFRCTSAIPAGAPIRVLVSDGPYLPVDPIECKAGDRDIEIRLRTAGEATATFLVDDSAKLGPLEFHLRRTQPPQELDMRARIREHQNHFVTTLEKGRIEWHWWGLTPGTYQLTVVHPDVAEPLVSIDGVTIAIGPCTMRVCGTSICADACAPSRASDATFAGGARTQRRRLAPPRAVVRRARAAALSARRSTRHGTCTQVR